MSSLFDINVTTKFTLVNFYIYDCPNYLSFYRKLLSISFASNATTGGIFSGYLTEHM